MWHLRHSFFISTNEFKIKLGDCRNVKRGGYYVGVFSDDFFPAGSLDCCTVFLDTLAVAPVAIQAPNTCVLNFDMLTVTGSDMNTQSIYYIAANGAHLVVFNDLFLARYLLDALGHKLHYQPTSADLTFFDHVFRLNAGEKLTVRVARNSLDIRIDQISRILETPVEFYDNFEHSMITMYTCLDRAVEETVAHGKPVNIALSGGIDSGTIAYLVRKHNACLTAYTMSTDWGTEYPEARETADALGVSLEQIYVSVDEIRSEISAVIRFFYFNNPESIEIALVAHCLYKKLFDREPIPRLFVTGYGSDLLNAGGISDSTTSDQLHADILHELRRTQLSNEFSNLAALQCGIQVRHPYWNVEVIKCALRVPPWHKVGEHLDKRYLREMMRGRLPDNTVQRTKLGAHRGTGLSQHLSNVFEGRQNYRAMINKLHRDIFYLGNFA